MLAKQIWRMHIRPNSLLARCYKVKYFPTVDVLKAPIGCNPSYAWRSLHSSINVILKGSCWRIARGNKVNIWSDNWLPFQPNYKVMTQGPENSYLNLVSDLLDVDSLQWNKDLLDTTFYPINKVNIE